MENGLTEDLLKRKVIKDLWHLDVGLRREVIEGVEQDYEEEGLRMIFYS